MSGWSAEDKRVYPKGALAPQLLGFVGTDNEGLAGIEYQYEGVLSGTAGTMEVVSDLSGNRLATVSVEEAVPGESITLTIDEDIQFETEKVLTAVVEQFEAKRACAVVLAPDTGEILAMANTPVFDTNDFSSVEEPDRRNMVVNDQYEPGSTFKMVVTAAALEEGLVTPETTFTLGRDIQVYDRVVHESHAESVPETRELTVTQILAQSSNVGTVKLGLEVGKTRLVDMISRFGFTEKLGIDFPGEAGGQMLTPEKWSGTTIANVPIGQGIAASPLQLAAAYAAVANDGQLVQPHLVRDSNQPWKRQVVSPLVAAELRDMLYGLGGGRHRQAGPGPRLRSGRQDGHGSEGQGRRQRLRGRPLHSLVRRHGSRRCAAARDLGHGGRAGHPAPGRLRSRACLRQDRGLLAQMPGNRTIGLGLNGGGSQSTPGGIHRMVESPPVRLSDLFASVEGCRLADAADVRINSLSYRSDQANDGTLFFCVPGFVRDGHDFAPDAVARGASALCVERLLDLPVAQAVVPSVRQAMGPVAAAFYGHPSSGLLAVGITGTNGKTTSAFLVAHLLDRAGRRAGLMGTVERRIGGEALPAGRTTPEALDIQRDLAAMVESGDEAAVLEVSSHALDLGRARGIEFRVVAFTNLTQDHLDYHETLEAYFAAKSRLFLDPEFAGGRPVVVINVDDPFGRMLAERCDPERLVRLSSSGEGRGQHVADLELSDFDIGPDGTTGVLVLRGKALELAKGAIGPNSRFEVKTRLVGAFNVANTLTALGIGLGLGLDLTGMLTALREFPGVPGRMEPVEVGQDFAVLVDYAHTPDSVRNVLRAAREITRGRLIAVLGCGGDRDRGKRPQMGRAAEMGADLVMITSDNPRTEKPEAIIAEIVTGLDHPSAARVQPDRRKAIAEAVAEARAGDVVLILGKGHESGQEFATETLPFDDRAVAREALLLLARDRQ